MLGPFAVGLGDFSGSLPRLIMGVLAALELAIEGLGFRMFRLVGGVFILKVRIGTYTATKFSVSASIPFSRYFRAILDLKQWQNQKAPFARRSQRRPPRRPGTESFADESEVSQIPAKGREPQQSEFSCAIFHDLQFI